MTVHPSARLVTLALVSVSLLCAGCSRAGASPAISDAAPAATTAEPSATASLSVTALPSIEVPPSESPIAEPPMAEPPAASIAVDGGDPVVGQLGTFTWDNSGSDAPWLNGSPIHVGTGEQLTLTLATPVGIGAWSVSRVPPGNRDGIGAVGMDHGSGEPVTFEAPPDGSWSVEVSARFAGERGTASYFWMIQVD